MCLCCGGQAQNAQAAALTNKQRRARYAASWRCWNMKKNLAQPDVMATRQKNENTADNPSPEVIIGESKR